MIDAYTTPTYSVAEYFIAHVQMSAVKLNVMQFYCWAILFYFVAGLFYFILHVQTAQTVKYVPGNLKGLNDMLAIITVK